MRDFSPLTNLDELLQTLDSFGVAVLPNVFSHDECETFKSKIFDYIEKNHDVREPNDFKKIGAKHGGIIHKYGIPLIPEVLDLKTDERTIEPFRYILYNQKNLQNFKSQ